MNRSNNNHYKGAEKNADNRSGRQSGRGHRKQPASHYTDQSNLMGQQYPSQQVTPPLPPEEPSESFGWVPPPELQRRVVELTESVSYTLFFPLELTNKDYMRRILEIVAFGIRSQVLWVTKQRRLPKMEGQHSGDVHYLLKQLLGNNRGEGEKAMDRLVIQGHFQDALNVSNKKKLFTSAEFILNARNELFHLQPDISRLRDVEALFQAAGDLLECFGTSAAKALAQLKALHIQQDLHRSFKEQRMTEFGWLEQEDEEEQTLVNDGAFDDLEDQDDEDEEGEGEESDDDMSHSNPSSSKKPMKNQIVPDKKKKKDQSTKKTNGINNNNTNNSKSTEDTAAAIAQATEYDRILSSWLADQFSAHTKLLSTLMHLSKDLETIRNLAAKNQQYADATALTDIVSLLNKEVIPSDTLLPATALLPVDQTKLTDKPPTNRIQQLISMVKVIEQFVSVLKNQELSCSKKLLFQEAQDLHGLADRLTKKKDRLKAQFEKSYSINASDYVSPEKFFQDLDPNTSKPQYISAIQQPLPQRGAGKNNNNPETKKIFENLRQHLLFVPFCQLKKGEQSSFVSIFSLTCLADQRAILGHWLSPSWLNATPADAQDLLRSTFTGSKGLAAVLHLFPKQLTLRDVGFPLELFPKDRALCSLLMKQEGRKQAPKPVPANQRWGAFGLSLAYDDFEYDEYGNATGNASSCYSPAELKKAGWQIEDLHPDLDEKEISAIFSLREMRESGIYSIDCIYSLWQHDPKGPGSSYYPSRRDPFSSIGYTIQELAADKSQFPARLIWSWYPQNGQTFAEMRSAGYDTVLFLQEEGNARELIPKARPLNSELVAFLKRIPKNQEIISILAVCPEITLRDLLTAQIDLQKQVPVASIRTNPNSSSSYRLSDSLRDQFTVQEFDRLGMNLSGFDPVYLTHGFGFTVDELLNRRYPLKKLVTLYSLPPETLQRRMGFSVRDLKNSHGLSVREVFAWYGFQTKEEEVGSSYPRYIIKYYQDHGGKRIQEGGAYSQEHRVARELKEAGYRDEEIFSTLYEQRQKR